MPAAGLSSTVAPPIFCATMRVEHQPPAAGTARVQLDSAVNRALTSCVLPAGTDLTIAAPGTSVNTVELVDVATLSLRFCMVSCVPPVEPTSAAAAVPPVAASA